MTPAEEALWQALRGEKLGGLRFRRQHPVGTFVLDFYCPACKLVVELDGAIHDDKDVAEHDFLRAQHIENYGYHVIRFRNEEIVTDLPSVLNRILRAASERRSAPPPSLLGEGAGGRGPAEGAGGAGARQ